MFETVSIVQSIPFLGKHFCQHRQNPEITASKGSQRLLRPLSARYRPSRLPWVQGGHPRAREPTRFAFSRSPRVRSRSCQLNAPATPANPTYANANESMRLRA